jgi:hypothetical protein
MAVSLARPSLPEDVAWTVTHRTRLIPRMNDSRFGSCRVPKIRLFL